MHGRLLCNMVNVASLMFYSYIISLCVFMCVCLCVYKNNTNSKIHNLMFFLFCFCFSFAILLLLLLNGDIYNGSFYTTQCVYMYMVRVKWKWELIFIFLFSCASAWMSRIKRIHIALVYKEDCGANRTFQTKATIFFFIECYFL